MAGTDQAKLLLIEDDLDAQQMLCDYLAMEGFEVSCAADGIAGLEAARSGQPALVVLDVMLPGLDGFGVLRQLRQVSEVPVLMLTARQDDIDKVLGLELGADDYLAKPYNPRELVARIRAILRRLPAVEAPAPDSLVLANLTLLPGRFEVRVDEQPVELTRTEFQLLLMLAQRHPDVVSREQLSLEVLNRPLEIYDRSLDVHISNLRRKLTAARVQIATRRGIGFQLEVT